MPFRSDAHAAQLAAARLNAHNPEALRRRGEKSRSTWDRLSQEEKARRIAALSSPEAIRKRSETAKRPVAERFWSFVHPEPNSGCYLWAGACSTHGYGQLRVDGRAKLATHVSLELHGKPRPSPDAQARHKCDNPPCVNPEHLEWGSARDNAWDAISRGRSDTSGLKIGRERNQSRKAQRQTKLCEQCGAAHQPTAAQLRKNKRFFCSTTCSVAWQKAAYTGRPKAEWAGK